ncbi:hypothetical protein ACTJKN_05335 [Pedobacter sp. 22163]|uniref:hypothetical protein n=1 Tax=Pedobacter sp. 22163 TaxID=3453883 RepID=UPI003F8479F7
MLTATDLKALKRRLPDDWVTKVQEKVTFGGTKIRETLRDPKKYNKEIIDATILVATEFELELETVAAIQRQKIHSKSLTTI